MIDRARGRSRGRAHRLGRLLSHLDVVHAENVAAVVHVLLQVLLQILEDERQRLVRVHDVVQRH